MEAWKAVRYIQQKQRAGEEAEWEVQVEGPRDGSPRWSQAHTALSHPGLHPWWTEAGNLALSLRASEAHS